MNIRNSRLYLLKIFLNFCEIPVFIEKYKIKSVYTISLQCMKTNIYLLKNLMYKNRNETIYLTI